MTPVYHNGNDYYKKMLELQRRLRRSEEERTRLEERFSLLEHESRSRHETCINRLRMRYIEFLEEQQARDERNHRLLGTLERVDSSLALISAKTDRLGNLRRQYEAASLLKNWYANGRANGSVTGDSGVASQNNEGEGGEAREPREGRISRRRKLDAFPPAVCPRGMSNVALGKVGIAATSRASSSPSKVLSDSCYNDASRTGIARYESSRAPTVSSAFHRKSDVDERERRPRYVINGRPVAAVTRSLSSRGGYPRFGYPRYGGYESTGAQSPPTSPSDYSSLGYSRNVFESERATRGAAAFPNNDALLNNYVDPIRNYSRFFEDGVSPSVARSPPGYPNVVDILGKERTRDDEIRRVGDVVENELERYMRRIPKLYRESPQSPEEPDQEQNTSGDLLNVTLSDDEVDFSAAAEQEAGIGGKSAAEARDRPARRQNSASGPKLAKVSQKIHEESENARGARDAGIANDTELSQLPEITSLSNARNTRENDALDTENLAEILAKNGISPDVAKDGTELGAAGPSRNDGDGDAKSWGSGNRELDADAEQTGNRSLAGNDRSEVNMEIRSGDLGTFNDPRYRVVSGAERSDENNFCEYTEDLEPWNLSALERRIQESSSTTMMMVLNDLGPRTDFSQGEFTRNPSGERSSDRERESNGSKSPNAFDSTKLEDQRKIERCAAVVVGNEDTGHPYDETKLGNKDAAPSNEEFIASVNEVTLGDEDPGQRPQEYNEQGADPFGSWGVVADESIDRSTREYPAEQQVHEPTGGEADPVGEYMEYGSPGTEEMYANPENASYAPEEYPQDRNLPRYEYPVGDRREEADERYQAQHYLAENDPRYEGGENGDQQSYRYEHDNRYESDDQQQYNRARNDLNEQYVVDAGQEYALDPNQAYFGDESQRYGEGDVYAEDENQGYPVASMLEHANYPEAQEYTGTEIHGEQSDGLPDNREFATESSDAQRYDDQRDETPMEQIHGASAVLVEPETRSVNELTVAGGELNESINADESNVVEKEELLPAKKSRDVIRSLLDSDTESTIERNVSNAESDFDFN